MEISSKRRASLGPALGSGAGRSASVTPLSSDILQVRFDSPESLRSEFEKNIANRGVFVATTDSFEVRSSVLVEIVLDYAVVAVVDGGVSPGAPALTLEGEIVHVLPPEMAASGAEPGVAVQFDASASVLRERFEPLLGEEAPSHPDEPEVQGRRGAKRGAVRVPVRVMPTSGPPFEATSRDLSSSGILVSMRDDVLPVGEIVRVCLWHPSGHPSVEIDGKVVRQVPNRRGRIAAVAVAFDRNQAADPRVADVIGALREAGHRSQLGGITGSLSDLGLANMLQMFGSSAPEGTLIVEHEGEQGWVAFAQGQMLGAELGSLSGKDALVTMLSFGDGRFQFEASVDAALHEGATPVPLAGAVLDAVCTLDELANKTASVEGAGAGESGFELDLGGDETEIAALPIESSTTFEVDVEQEDLSRGVLDKADDAILELAKAGMSVERLCSVIPEPPERIEASIEALVELGVLVPR